MRSTGVVSDLPRAELLEPYQRAQAQFTARVDAVEPGQWDVPVLPGWTVLDLVAHRTADQLAVPRLLAGGSRDDARPTPAGELLGDDPLSAWEDAADDALTAWAAHGALDGTLDLPGGPVPAAHHLRAMTADLTVHAWDLARAVGGDTRLDRSLVVDALDFAEEHIAEDGVPGLVDPPVPIPSGADPLTRLVARYGRRV